MGGVDLWKIEVGDVGDDLPAIGDVDTTNVGFINFINFTASFFGGLLETGNNNQATNLTNEDFVDVEIRFGDGQSQMMLKPTPLCRHPVDQGPDPTPLLILIFVLFLR